MRAGPSRLGALVATVALAIVLAACGVSTSGSPQAISKSLVPSPPPPAATDHRAERRRSQVTIVLLNAATNAPVPVARYVPQPQDNLHDHRVPTSSWVPNRARSTEASGSAIPAGTKLIGVSPNPAGTPGVEPSLPVTVNLSVDFIRRQRAEPGARGRAGGLHRRV